jgi:hypothetical protein
VSAQRIDGDPCGPGTFLVPSATEPGRVWAVDWQNAAVRFCGCPQFARKNDCRHVREAEALWRREHEALLAAHRADPARQAQVSESLQRMKEMFS